MDQNYREGVIRLLANDALEATADRGAEAAMLLIDTALSIAVTKLGSVGAHEMSGMLIGYIMRQGDALLDASQGGAAS